MTLCPRLVSIFSAVALVACGTTGNALADTPGWVLTQSSSMLGTQTIYLTPSAIRIDHIKRGVSVVSKLPDGKIITFSRSSQRYYSTSFKNWQGMMSNRVEMLWFGYDATKSQWRRVGAAKVAGAGASVYAVAAYKPTAENIGAKEEWLILKDFKECRYFLGDQIKTSATLANVLAKCYGFPPLGKVPLRFSRYPANWTGDRPEISYDMDTVEIKKASLPDSTFEVPHGFTAAASDIDVSVDDAQADGLRTFFAVPEKKKKP